MHENWTCVIRFVGLSEDSNSSCLINFFRLILSSSLCLSLLLHQHLGFKVSFEFFSKWNCKLNLCCRGLKTLEQLFSWDLTVPLIHPVPTTHFSFPSYPPVVFRMVLPSVVQTGHYSSKSIWSYSAHKHYKQTKLQTNTFSQDYTWVTRLRYTCAIINLLSTPCTKISCLCLDSLCFCSNWGGNALQNLNMK